TAQQTRTRPFKPWPQMKAECLERFMIKHEKQVLRGAKKEVLTGSHPKRTFGGLEEFITETKDFNGSVSLNDLEDQLQIAFKYGSKDKGFVCGNTAVKILNRVARNHAALNFDMTDRMNKDQTFGLAVTEWITPFGILRIIPHNLMSESDVYTQDGYVLDFKYIQRVKLRGRDIKWNGKAQENDRDGQKGYYQGELGFSLALPEVHQKWTEMSAFAPDA
ncbi:MAG: SU10 major capsid protein, partial [Planctomycetota bacterium]